MRVECGDDSGPALRAGKLYGAAGHGLMPGMKSVEIPQRHDAAAQMRGHRGAAVQPLHEGRYRHASGRWQCAAARRKVTKL